MAKLPIFKRILREDVKEADSWIEKLLYPINLVMEGIYNALNKDITFKDNIACQIKTITFVTRGDYTSGGAAYWEDIKFQSTLKNKAIGCFIIDIKENGSSFIPSSFYYGATVSWVDIDGEIQLKYITGLKDSTKYTVTLLIF